MRKYLKSQVGRLWNDIWSDIAAAHDVRNYSDLEFREAIKGQVYFDVIINEDGMYDRKGGRLFAWRGIKFYVDENGILKALPQDKRYRYQKPESKIVRLNGLEYYNHDGIWYEVVTEPSKKYRSMWFGDYYHDVFGFRFGTAHRTYNEDVIITKKKQCGKKIIKKINKHLGEQNG